MLRAFTFDMQALAYGPAGPDLLSEILRTESFRADPADVADALDHLPPELQRARVSLRTEAQEDDYHRAMLPALLEALGTRLPTDALLMRLLEQLHEYHAFYSMYPETLPVLEALRSRGHVLAVVANWQPSLQRFIREFELDEYFRTSVASAEVGSAKPDPFIFQQALAKMGMPAADTCHVGPSLQADVGGAVAAGMQAVWLNRTGICTGHEVLTVTDLRGVLAVAGKADI